MRSACVILSLLSFLPITATAQTAPLTLERVGVWPAGSLTAVDADGSLVAWGYGRELVLARLEADRTLTVLGRLLLPGPISAITLADTTAVVAVSEQRLAFVDVSDPAAPVVADDVDVLWSGPMLLAAEPPHVYVTRGNRLRVWVVEPDHTSSWGREQWRGDQTLTAIATDGDRLVASDRSDLHVFDISERRFPHHLASLPHPRSDHFSAVAIAGDLVLLGFGRGLMTVDIGDPAHPHGVGEHEGHYWPLSIVMRDGFALVATEESLLSVDLADPSEMVVAPVADLRPMQLATVDGGMLARTRDRLELVAASGPGSATSESLQLLPETGPIHDLELVADGTIVTSGPGLDGSAVRALRADDDGRLGEWTRLPSPNPLRYAPLARVGDDLVAVGVDEYPWFRFEIFQVGELEVELLASCCDDLPLWAITAADGVIWATSDFLVLDAVDASNPRRPEWLAGIFLTGPNGPYRRGPADRYWAVIEWWAYAFGGVGTWVEDGLLARWIDWVHYNGRPYDVTHENQVRLIDVRDPARPTEVGIFRTDEQLVEGVARHGDRLLISLVRDHTSLLQKVSLADPALPAIVAEREVDPLPVDAVPFGRWLVGRDRVHGSRNLLVLVDPDTLETWTLDLAPDGTEVVDQLAVLWPWIAVGWNRDAVELYRVTER